MKHIILKLKNYSLLIGSTNKAYWIQRWSMNFYSPLKVSKVVIFRQPSMLYSSFKGGGRGTYQTRIPVKAQKEPVLSPTEFDEQI